MEIESKIGVGVPDPDETPSLEPDKVESAAPVIPEGVHESVDVIASATKSQVPGQGQGQPIV